MTEKKEFGDRGEEIAKKFLEKKGLKFIDRNFRALGGEIDLVFYDQKSKEYVLVEVKTRSSDAFGEGLESITKSKFKKILAASRRFFFQKLHLAEIPFFRIDAVSVSFKGDGFSCEHIEFIGWDDF